MPRSVKMSTSPKKKLKFSGFSLNCLNITRNEKNHFLVLDSRPCPCFTGKESFALPGGLPPRFSLTEHYILLYAVHCCTVLSLFPETRAGAVCALLHERRSPIGFMNPISRRPLVLITQTSYWVIISTLPQTLREFSSRKVHFPSLKRGIISPFSHLCTSSFSGKVQRVWPSVLGHLSFVKPYLVAA